MTFEEYKSISRRIESFLSCSLLYLQGLNGEEKVNIATLRELYNIIKILEKYKEDIKPGENSIEIKTIISCIDQFFNENIGDQKPFIPALFAEHSSQKPYRGLASNIVQVVHALSYLNSELIYHFSDKQLVIKNTVEVAFAHLQRSIVVNSSLDKSKKFTKVKPFNIWEWNKDNNEDYYERLGSAHLLEHKIWGVKANAEGERTDLILKEVMDGTDPLASSCTGMVLTEWKLYNPKNGKLVENLINEPSQQADRYRSGSLYPFELRNYCYVIIVSEKHIKEIEKGKVFLREGITYRVINIACNPDTPS